jgi:predicted dehydrogenase
MKIQTSRRTFVKQSALASGVFAAAPFNILTAASAGERIRVAQIGCGGRGTSSHLAETLNEHLVAIVDVDDNRVASAQNWLKSKERDVSKVKVFHDYRRMFDQVGRDIDAVFIATPNHHHALPSLIAMQLGKSVYCEKPVCHDIAEGRAMSALAARSKVATQMGNQGHCMDGYRKLCEYIWSGTIGKVTETHSWTNRANGGEGPRPPTEPAPAGLHWDEWIGPAPYRDFHGDLHPHSWHGWYDFGNGSIGNMGCHVLNGVYWALKVDHPTSIEVEHLRGGSNERYPMGCRVRWDITARGDMPAVKAYWYEGLNPTTTGRPQGNLRAAQGDDRNLPPVLLELREKYPDEELDRGDSGTHYVGEKGVIFTGTYGDKMHIVPYEKMRETPKEFQKFRRGLTTICGVDLLRCVLSAKIWFITIGTGTGITEMVMWATREFTRLTFVCGVWVLTVYLNALHQWAENSCGMIARKFLKFKLQFIIIRNKRK